MDLIKQKWVSNPVLCFHIDTSPLCIQAVFTNSACLYFTNNTCIIDVKCELEH